MLTVVPVVTPELTTTVLVDPDPLLEFTVLVVIPEPSTVVVVVLTTVEAFVVVLLVLTAVPVDGEEVRVITLPAPKDDVLILTAVVAREKGLPWKVSVPLAAAYTWPNVPGLVDTE